MFKSEWYCLDYYDLERIQSEDSALLDFLKACRKIRVKTQIYSEIRIFTRVINLNLENNEYFTFPIEICSLVQLRKLNLGDNSITSIPPEISQLFQLKKLELHRNKISVLPKELFQLFQLRQLSLSRNEITTIPEELKNLSQLEVLHLNHNQLKFFPPEIFSLRQLELLSLDYNHITSIPPEISSLRQIEHLYISGNQLSKIPKELSELKQLESLDISTNFLREIPPNLFQCLDQFEFFAFFENQITFVEGNLEGKLQKLQHSVWSEKNINLFEEIVENKNRQKVKERVLEELVSIKKPAEWLIFHYQVMMQLEMMPKGTLKGIPNFEGIHFSKGSDLLFELGFN